MICPAKCVDGRPCSRHVVRGAALCSAHLNRGTFRTKLEPETADRLVTMLRAGNYLSVSCRACGIAHRTFDDWMARGLSERPEDAPYREIRERVDVARAEGETRHVARIAQAAASSWQAAAWLLERSYPERWGRVSVAARDAAQPPPLVEPTITDPFAEVDDLAEARRRRDAG